MTLVIQRAEHRDTQAIHAKLDEILHAMGEARNELTKLGEEAEAIARQRSISVLIRCARRRCSLG
jgi:low affinity Fe/Cu permease